MSAPPQRIIPDDSDVLPAVRELFSQHPEAEKSGPETLSRLLYVLRFLPWQPNISQVATALEALPVEDGVLA